MPDGPVFKKVAMNRETRNRPCSRFWARFRRFAGAAACLLLAGAGLFPSASAGQQAADPLAPATRFEIRFVPAAEREAVPYERVRGTALFKAEVDGREVWAMLDNRVTSSVLDAAFARSLGIELDTLAGRFRTPSGSLERWRVPEVAIRVPGQISMRRPIFAADLSFLSGVTDRPVSLIMGNEYFDGLAVLFTPHDRHIAFAPSGTMDLPADTPHLVLLDDRPRVEVTIAGRPVVLTVDLGFNGDIAVNEKAWIALGLNASSATIGRAANADGRVFAMPSAIVGEVALGSTPVNDVKVTLQPVFADDGDGFIGLGLLSRFTFALDVRARRLWLIAPEAR
jgi:predicted aspartyl protease